MLIFAFGVLYLQSLKAPWVDECYSYFGVWHDNFSEFYDSMLTGINFSPPLYFLINFTIQTIFPTSIEQLRFQSLVFIILGIFISFLLTRKHFGSTTAFISTILVASQSVLLLCQAQEARHYSMFFACGAWVLYMQGFNDIGVKKYQCITFFAHLCLCQVHYLGIIFSGLVGLSLLISENEKTLIKRIPFHVFAAWILTLPIYLLLLTHQSSHLGNWSKPNELSDLLNGYNDSLLILTIMIPVFVFIIINKTDRSSKTQIIEGIRLSRPIAVTSLLWVSVPFVFWIISNLTSLNLFVDRYFIPKESALVFLFAYGLSFVLQQLPHQKSKGIHISSTFGFSLVLCLLSIKRAAFGLNKETNYHHSLIIEKIHPNSEQPMMLEGDPRYFPNAYLGKYKFVFGLKNSEFKEIYSKFSKRIQIK